jgi:D-aminoacyl-tRNA deacylase
MRIVIQRTSTAKVTIEGVVSGEINQGLLVLLGIEEVDEQADADWLCSKLAALRIFADDAGKMNLCITDVEGAFLVVSQFTLHASYKKGNRPSFIKAAGPEKAIPLYEYFIRRLHETSGCPVETGVFGAMMEVSLVNDGPVTIVMDSRNKE